MKKMFLILIILPFIVGCNSSSEEEPKQSEEEPKQNEEESKQNEEEPKQEESSIYGTWQLVESFSHPPTGNGWRQVEKGFIITIKTDNSFSSSEFSDCKTGTIMLKSDTIDLIYSCDEFNPNGEDPKGTLKYGYKFVSKKLELTPKNFSCYEGCQYRLVKKDVKDVVE